VTPPPPLDLPHPGRVQPRRLNAADDGGALRRLARELKQPAYCVFADRTLIELACAHPTTERQMLAVSGVGPAKMEKFGEAFLRVLRGEE